MLTINNILLISICLFFPISLYQNYLTYVKTLEIKEKTLLLEFSLYASLLLLFRFTNDYLYTSIFYSIPLIISLRRKNYKTALVISIISILLLDIPTSIIGIKYLIYIFIYMTLKRERYKLLSVSILELLFMVYLSHTLNIDIVLAEFIFILFSYLEIIFITNGSRIVDLNSVLQELNREKLLRSSISKLTHELKNPIAVCNGYLEMFDLKNTTKATKYISILKSEITRSKNIIDEFSNYGKLKKVDKEEMDLAYLFEDIKELLEPLFKLNKATLSVTCKEEIYILGDYNKLKQVFINLLKNTIEAKQELLPLKTIVTIKDKKHKVDIDIKDNGIGMNAETLNRVSELFFTTKANGTGLGLAYSKEVIELHSGTFKITSEENIGTTIKISLPK